MLYLGGVLLLVSSVFGQGCVTLGSPDGTCGSQAECLAFMSLTHRQTDTSLQPFFRTTLSQELQNYVRRCCGSAPTGTQKGIIPGEDVCGFAEPTGPANDIQRRGAWPWLVALGYMENGVFKLSCGGVLITRRHVLTSAWCMGTNIKQPPTIVRLGDYDITTGIEANHVERRIVRHQDPGWNEKTNQNDISILTLDSDVQFNDYMRPACLPFDYASETFLNKIVAVVGYGSPFFGGDLRTKPLAAVVSVTNLVTCQESYNRLATPVPLSESQLCAGGKNDACKGDSGGPLNFFNPSTQRFYVVGLVSFGVGCGNPEYPGVYARVGAYLQWIMNTVNNDA